MKKDEQYVGPGEREMKRKAGLRMVVVIDFVIVAPGPSALSSMAPLESKPHFPLPGLGSNARCCPIFRIQTAEAIAR